MVVVVAAWVQAGNPRLEDPRCPGAGMGAHGAATSAPWPYSHLTTELPLTQRHPGPAESSLGLAQAGVSPLQRQVCAPVLVEVMPGFSSAPPRMFSSPSPPPPPAPGASQLPGLGFPFPPGLLVGDSRGVYTACDALHLLL